MFETFLLYRRMPMTTVGWVYEAAVFHVWIGTGNKSLTLTVDYQVRYTVLFDCLN